MIWHYGLAAILVIAAATIFSLLRRRHRSRLETSGTDRAATRLDQSQLEDLRKNSPFRRLTFAEAFREPAAFSDTLAGSACELFDLTPDGALVMAASAWQAAEVLSRPHFVFSREISGRIAAGTARIMQHGRHHLGVAVDATGRVIGFAHQQGFLSELGPQWMLTMAYAMVARDIRKQLVQINEKLNLLVGLHHAGRKSDHLTKLERAYEEARHILRCPLDPPALKALSKCFGDARSAWITASKDANYLLETARTPPPKTWWKPPTWWRRRELENRHLGEAVPAAELIQISAVCVPVCSALAHFTDKHRLVEEALSGESDRWAAAAAKLRERAAAYRTDEKRQLESLAGGADAYAKLCNANRPAFQLLPTA